MRCFKQPGFSPVYNNDTVSKGDLLQFEATPQSGQLLNKWTVNGVEQGYATNKWFQYRVQPWDVQSGSITIDYTVKPAAQVTIHFDSGKIACYNQNYANVHDGETVYENDKLDFVAKLSPGQLVDKWKVNGVEKEDETNKKFRYTVRTEDAQSNGITIDYTVKPSPQGTIHFDSSKIGCYYSLILRVVDDGETVYENDSLVFYAKNLPPGKTVDKWKVNGVEKEDETETSFSYTVKAEDVQSGSITIDYTLK